MYIYIYIHMYIYIYLPVKSVRRTPRPNRLAFTRYCFALKLYCGSRASVCCAKPTLLHYYCTPNAQYTPPHGPLLFMPYTIQY